MVAPVTYFINRHADSSGSSRARFLCDEGCRYLRNVFALRYIPRDDPVIIMNVVVVVVVSIGHIVVNSGIGSSYQFIV